MTSQMITKEQLAELASLARAATPGPWECQTSNGWRRVGTTAANRGRRDGDVVANGAATPANMAYIAAANPATVLALIADNEAKAAELAEWRKLKDPNALHINMLAGIPARLPAETLLHLAGEQYQGMAARIAELEREVEDANQARREAQLATQAAQTSRDSAITQARRELGARIIELERDSARLDYMIENGLFVEAFIMPDLPKMRPLCWLVNFKTGPIVKKQFEDPRAAIDAAMAPPRCTCPSGDGSLRWPCPRHPPGAT